MGIGKNELIKYQERSMEELVTAFCDQNKEKFDNWVFKEAYSRGYSEDMIKEFMKDLKLDFCELPENQQEFWELTEEGYNNEMADYCDSLREQEREKNFGV